MVLHSRSQWRRSGGGGPGANLGGGPEFDCCDCSLGRVDLTDDPVQHSLSVPAVSCLSPPKGCHKDDGLTVQVLDPLSQPARCPA